MREVILYYAYDDTEFDSREECEAYENKARGWLNELVNAYNFFLPNGQEICIYPGDDIDDAVYFIEYAFNKCARIRIKYEVSNEVLYFIQTYCGLIMPQNESGLYEYDDNAMKWVKVDE